jgi:hypothetical protein
MGMFNQAPPPAYWTPFNVNMGGNMGAMMLQMAMPALAQSMGGPQNFPAQFLPTQNLWDQFHAQRYWQGQQQAMTQAATLDVANVHQTLMGAQRMMTGRAPTVQQQQQLRGMAETLGEAMPMASMLFGAETMDMLMGPRGSATVMAQQMHRGLRTSRDPFTGATGVRGQTAGLMAQEVYNQLYGPGADLAEMRGMTAGQSGALFELLQQRGMAGPDLGARTPQERLMAVSNASFNEGTQRRVAEAYIRGQGRDVTPESLSAAREQIFSQQGTLGQVQAGVTGGGMDVQRMMEMPGAEELLSATQAQTISRRLKNLSGAVSAMRDIFGDMGNPNAPMREIVQGLEALTQGGLASMAPGQLEQVVRTTRNLAETSGLGMQGMLGLQAQNANLADQLGLDRTLAVNATQQSAAWSTAARQTQRLDQPVFGRLTAEEQTLLNNQIQMGGMASQTGNMVGATVRMQQEGIVTAGTDADLLAQAIMAGRTEWTDSGGKRRSVAMSNAEWAKVMTSSGVARGTAESVLSDRYMSQEYIRDFQLGGLTRQLQREVDIAPRVANTYSDAMGTQINQQGVGDVLRARMGMTGDDINKLTNAAAADAAQRMLDLDAGTVNNKQKLNMAMARIAEETISAQVRARGGTDADVQAALDAMGPVNQDGVRQGSLEMGIAMRAELDSRIQYDPNMSGYRSSTGLWQMQNRATVTQQRAQIAEAQTTGRMQSAMSRVGRHGPIARLIGEMQGSPEDRSLGEIFANIMGFVPAEELELTALGGLRSAMQEFDRAERYTSEMALQEEMDLEIARRQGMSLSDYRAQIAAATGEDRDRMLQERDSMRENLRQDADFMERTSGIVSARTGTLTDRGVAQRNLATSIAEGLTEGGQRAEAARQMIAKDIGGADTGLEDMNDAWWEAQIQRAATPAEKRRIAALREANMVLQGAQRGQIVGTQLEAMGLALDTTVAGEEVGAIAEQGDEAQQLVDALRPPPQNADAATQARYREDVKRAVDATDRHLTNARTVADTIQASTADMMQLGREGGAAVRDIQKQSGELDALAARASDQLGRPVTAAELIAGKGPADLVQQAQALNADIQKSLTTVRDIKSTGYMAGREGSQATALGKYEQAAMEARADFLSGKAVGPVQVDPNASAADRAAAVQRAQGEYVTDQLLKNVSASTAAAYGAGSITRGELVELAGGRSASMAGALAAREQLVTIAADRGVITGPDGEPIDASQIASLTGEQRQTALTKLFGMSREELGDDMYAQVQSLKQQQEQLAGIGQDDTAGDIRRRVEGFNEVGRGGAGGADGIDGQDRKIAATVTGTLKMTGDVGQIEGDMVMGDFQHNDVQTGVVGMLS